MQCDAGQPFQPTPDTGSLSVSPRELTDSAAEGSIALRTTSVTVGASGAAALPWQAAVRQQSTWLRLGSSSGMAPGPLTLSADPQGLAAGTYRDTIALTRTDMTAGQVLVPVAFEIQPCAVTGVTLDGEWTDSLRESSCGAPNRTGSFGQLFGFSADAGDSVSLELIAEGFDGYIVLDTVIAASPLAVAQGCEDAGKTCLRYQLLPRTGPYVIEATSAAARAAGRFTLRASRPRAPTPPLELGQFRGDASTELAVGQETHEARVIFAGTVRDDDAGDTLRLEIEVKDIAQPFDGSVSGTSEAEAAGARAVVQLDLADGDYHWRARTRDHTGRTGSWTSYGGNAAGSADLRVAVQQAPALPEALEQLTLQGAAIETGGLARGETVMLRGLVADANAEDRLRFEVEVRPVDQPFTNFPTATSGLVVNGTIAAVLVSGLQDSVSYHWQARAVDEQDKPGAWGVFGANAEAAPDFAVALPPSGLAFLDQPATASAGALLAPFRIAAVDAAGRVLKSFDGAIAVALQSPSGAGVISGSNTVVAVAGIATFSDLRIEQAGEQYTITASAAGLPSLASISFGISPAPASQLVFSTAPVSLSAGELLSPVHVRAVDAFGNTVTGFEGQVTLTLGPSGVLAGTTSVIASAGVAQFTDLRVEQAGQGYTLIAAAAGIADVVSSSFNVSPGNATHLVFTTSPSSAVAGGAIAIQLAAQDAFGNTATTFTGIVSISLGPTGALGGTTSVSAVAGIATFTDLIIAAAGESYVLTATSSGVQDVVSAAFSVSAAAAEHLVFTTTPGPTTAGQVLDLQVTARDAFGNTATGFTAPVTVFLAPSGTLSGTTTIHAVAGVATFTDLSVLAAGEGYTLTASGGGVPAIVSPSFSVSPAGAAQLAFTTAPSSTTAGTPLSVQLTAQDAFGNTATGFTGAVTLELGPSGALVGTTTALAVGG
jgi:hypothetical protein